MYKKWILIILFAIPIYIAEQQYETIQRMQIEYDSMDKQCDFLQQEIVKLLSK